MIETASDSSPRRESTNGHINGASNVLAHYLVLTGVKASEVIMVHAHRVLELPVAVKGILEAVYASPI